MEGAWAGGGGLLRTLGAATLQNFPCLKKNVGMVICVLPTSLLQPWVRTYANTLPYMPDSKQMTHSPSHPARGAWGSTLPQ